MWDKYYKNLGIISCLLGVSLCEIKAGTAMKCDTFSSQDVKTSLKINGPLQTYAAITAKVQEMLNKVKNNIDWINDLTESINEALKNRPEVRPDLCALEDKRKQLIDAFTRCNKEIKYEPQGNCSPLVNAIKDLKELQLGIQEFKITTDKLLVVIRQIIQKNQYTPVIQSWYNSKLELKLIDRHENEIEETINQTIQIVIVSVEAYNEAAYEERNRGSYTTPSHRSLTPFFNSYIQTMDC
ncbi:MAG: hypothetical protein LBH08_00990 [Puniceicoccales bacterium]|jgi:hypothetical protein|nr:hypothetical protein [Puniceicoccales bacterium]